jgi:error-prone DNA polymerase
VPAPDYVELRCRSAFSFLQGASNPEDLATRAGELGHAALALADRGGLYGAPRFHAAARSAGVRPISGAEVAVEGGPALLLLVPSPRGWRALSRLLTLGHAGRPKGECAVTWEELEEHAADLVALVRGDEALAPAALDRARAILPDRLWLDVSRHPERRAAAAERRAVALAEAAGVPVVATGDVRFARPAGRRLLDAFTCLREKTTLDRAGRLLAPNAARCLRRPGEVAARFADRPEWLRASRAIAERCAFTLDHLGYRFPDFPVPPGETQPGLLRRLVFDGARRRYGHPLPPRARAQLEHELAVIGKLALDGYFLIVWDVARTAREQGILCQGRGSAANSAVCYALEITAVDPVGMELLFERFLSEERGEWPDIDLDLPSGERRERVIQYVYGRYGPHGAGMTATVISYRTRSAVRELGKALGLSPEQVDRLARLVSSWEHDEARAEIAPVLRQAGVDPDAPRVRLLFELAAEARGLPRHLGQHTGGIVIAAGRLDEVVPLEPAAMPGRTVVQWDKDDCADLGIIKIDLLGLGMLAALEEVIPLVREHEGVALDLAKLPSDDAATWAMIQRADTVGVFQIESRAQMATLPRLRPRCFYDLVVEIAIIRPGPIVGQMVHPYLNRRAGREPVTYPHSSLEPVLARTLGVPLFQEQLLRIAMLAAGFSGGEAEELRRAMGFKRSVDRMDRIEARLRAGMRARGIGPDAAEEIVRGIKSFALYGFPESHSASFALIAWASAYLKAHHPAAFLVGLLNAQPMGFYSPSTLVADAQRHGVDVRPVDVARSGWNASLELATPDCAEAGELEAASPATRSSPSHPEATPGAQRASEARSEAKPSGGGCPPRSGGAARSGAERRPSRGPTAREGQSRKASEDRKDRRASCAASSPAVRLGLRCVGGLSEETARRIERERARRPFAHLADFAARAAPRRHELDALAELGALASIDPAARGRRSALWQVAALERDPRSLFAGRPPAGAAAPAPLAEMTPLEETLADYRVAGLTTGPHALAHLRAGLRARGLLSAEEVRAAPDGAWVRTAGHVIVRQRPGSAKGFCFLTLEDETGTANAVLTPRQFQRFRAPLHAASILELAGPVQNVDGVVHVRVRELRALAAEGTLPRGHDYR